MPTLPASEPQPHEHREVAESFGTDAERYDRSRPSYPRSLVDKIILGSPGRSVLDVGCGTGIAARQFQAAGCVVLGIDPDERMAAVARRSGVDAEVATFESWDPDGRTFDAVIAAQAWHWVDPLAGAAAASRVLRPGGRLTVFWNAFRALPAVNAAFTAVYRDVLPDSPIHQHGLPGPDGYQALCDKAADAMVQVGAFGAPEHWRFDWERRYSRDEWLDQQSTFGGHNLLPPPTLAALLDGIGAAIDAMGGAFTMPYTTVATSAVRA
jgi:SAM-dependent methyltransferase